MTPTAAPPNRAATLRTALSLILMALLAGLLVACSSAPKKRIFPPSVSVQELRVLADGRWEADLRVQNFSTVAMRFERLQADFTLAGHAVASIDHVVADSVPPNSAEIVRIVLQPGAEAAEAVRSALQTRRGLGYRLKGSLASSEPGTREDRFEFDSALTPMPGLDGVLR